MSVSVFSLFYVNLLYFYSVCKKIVQINEIFFPLCFCKATISLIKIHNDYEENSNANCQPSVPWGTIS